MKLSLNYLEKHIIDKVNWDYVFEKLTYAGIEIEGFTTVAPFFTKVVVAKVIECNKFENTDKLNICQVDVGEKELLQIICGAPNVKAGIKIPCALVGAVLKDNFEITKRKIRGVESSGMLCSASELGLEDKTDGIMILNDDAPLGEDVRKYLSLDDKVIEFKITPNRGDVLSIRGLLREIKALTNYQIDNSIMDLGSFHSFNNFKEDKSKLEIKVQNEEYCPKYVGLLIKNIDNEVVLPEEITKVVKDFGIKSVSPVVDITNFVMIQLGQPLHVFDYDKVGSTINVRMAQDGEQIDVLTKETINLKSDTLIIADEKDKPIAIAGIMGGLNSAITINSKNIIIESALFDATMIAKASKSYNLKTDALYRYERNVDFNLQEEGAFYCAYLITKYCKGEVLAIYKNLKDITNKQVDVLYSNFNKLLGMTLEKQLILDILLKLEFKLDNISNEGFTAIAPSFRSDINIYQDILEEVVRIYGYNNLPTIMPKAQYKLMNFNDEEIFVNQARLMLKSLGYSEVINYSFVENDIEKLYNSNNPLFIQNPIASLNVMRSSMIGSLIKNLIFNLNRGCKSIKIFEIARVFLGENENTQPLKLTALIYGSRQELLWDKNQSLFDFYDLSGDVQNILSGIKELSLVPTNDYFQFHECRCAKINAYNKEIGVIGQLHPRYLSDLSVKELPYIFELDIANVSKVMYDSNNSFVFTKLSKHQKVERDLSFIINKKYLFGDISNIINQAHIPNLYSFNLFDIYENDDIANDYKSIAIKFILQANKTLEEHEIKASISQIVELLKKHFAISLRE